MAMREYRRSCPYGRYTFNGDRAVNTLLVPHRRTTGAIQTIRMLEIDDIELVVELLEREENAKYCNDDTKCQRPMEKT